MNASTLGKPPFLSANNHTVGDDARTAVHVAMAGKTGVVIGFLHERFVLLPIELLAGKRKSVDPTGPFWACVLSSTGQPENL